MRLKQPLNAFYRHSVRCAYPVLEHGGEKRGVVWLRYRSYPFHHVSRIKGEVHLTLIQPTHPCVHGPQNKGEVLFILQR